MTSTYVAVVKEFAFFFASIFLPFAATFATMRQIQLNSVHGDVMAWERRKRELGLAIEAIYVARCNNTSVIMVTPLLPLETRNHIQQWLRMLTRVETCEARMKDIEGLSRILIIGLIISLTLSSFSALALITTEFSLRAEIPNSGVFIIPVVTFCLVIFLFSPLVVTWKTSERIIQECNIKCAGLSTLPI